MLGAVIFDFDGVVADSELLHYRALNSAFGLHGVKVPKDEYYERYLGYGDYECVEIVNEDYNMGLDGEGIEKLIAHKTTVFNRLVKQDAAIIDGVADFVEMLRANEIPMAVCSGGTQSDIALMIEGTELAGVFDPIVSADDVKKGKPHPEGFELALRRLNEHGNERILPGQCVVIEDSHWGLEAARMPGNWGRMRRWSSTGSMRSQCTICRGCAAEDVSYFTRCPGCSKTPFPVITGGFLGPT